MEPENIKITPHWNKSKEDIWNGSFAALEDILPATRTRTFSFWKYAAAVFVGIVLAGSITARFFTRTETVARATHSTVYLPDGSKVNLNADSRLTYKPYWWFASRTVELEGEAYFEVTPGKRFSVKSGRNQVNVLGTSFNVFARPGKYIISCLTGKVEVVTDDNVTILNPDMQLTECEGKHAVVENRDAGLSIGWITGRFVFIGVPLTDVVEEIERQYNIEVLADKKPDYLYTGNFSATNEPDEILEIIGKPFGINFSIK